MQLPLVSIMIPTYNQANFVHRAIESALMQDYTNLEIIVADDCSTDNTKEVVAKYTADSRLKYFKHSTNLGRVANYKFILENLASGDWVVNLDGDDFYTDNSFITYVISLIKDNVVLVQTGRVNVEFDALEDGLPLFPNISTDVITMKGVDYVRKFDKIDFFSHMTTVYNRRKALELDFYRYDILSSDMESLLRLALCGDVVLSRRICGAWVGHANNSVRNNELDIYIKNLLWVESVADTLEKITPITSKEKKQWIRTQSIKIITHLTYIAKVTKQRGHLLLLLWNKYPWVFTQKKFYNILTNSMDKVFKCVKNILPLSLRRKLAHTYRYLYYRERAHNKALHGFMSNFRDKVGLEIGGCSPNFGRKGNFPVYVHAKTIDGCVFSNNTTWEGLITSKYRSYDNVILGEQFIGEAIEITSFIKRQYDFIVSSFCLEHIANPIKAVKECVDVLKPNGYMLFVLPVRAISFDHRRPYTLFSHLLSDYENNIDERDLTHYDEIVSLTDLAKFSTQISFGQFLERSKNNYENRCFHHHVFSAGSLKEIFNFLNIKILYCNTVQSGVWIVGKNTHKTS